MTIDQARGPSLPESRDQMAIPLSPITPPNGLVIPIPPVTPPATPAASKHEYLGHPQPNIDQRLLQAKNFLADEDPDRYLYFEDKIKEIEEYITYLERAAAQSPEDFKLLQDVKTMVAAHRNWQTRQKEFGGPILTHNCDPDAPKIQSYSNRLISTETSHTIEDGKVELGLDGQIREDRTVLSYQSGMDHHEFLKKMQDDVVQDPADVEADTNLSWIESRAYVWALNDPALINHWMHPTRGIPNKPLGLLDDTPWYKCESRNHSATARNRPPRTWIPDYLKKREDRINELLSLPSTQVGQFEELEKLLRFHEPCSMMKDHEAVQQVTLLRDWGFEVSEDALDKASYHFEEQYIRWVVTFQADGVQLMLRARGSAAIQSDQPGVFYVEDGSLDKNRKRIINQANALLMQYRSGKAWSSFSEAEKASFNSFLDHSTPPKITNLQRRKCGIIQKYRREQKTNEEAHQDLEWIGLGLEIDNFRKLRRRALKRTTKLFHYIRPGEMFDPDKDDLYIPWDWIRDAAMPFLPPLPAAEPVTALTNIEQAINQGFQKGLSTTLEDGDPTFLLLLQQVAYPELRAILIPFLDLCQREIQQGITSTEIALMSVFRPIVHDLWNHWIHGFTISPGVKRVTVVMPIVVPPKTLQQPKRPDFIYCRSKDPDHDPVICESSLGKINDLLQKDLENLSEKEKAVHFNNLNDLFPPFHRYPALNMSNKNNGATEQAEAADKKFRFDQWMISKMQYTLSIHRYNEYNDPDDDPTVVYYGGPLPTFSELKAQLPIKRIEEIISLASSDHSSWLKKEFGFNYAGQIGDDLPEVLRDQLSLYWPQGQPTRIKALMDWFVFEVGNKTRTSLLNISDYIPCGMIENSEDGIDNTDTIVDKNAKHYAKLERQVRKAAKAKKKNLPYIPFAPNEHSGDIDAVPDDSYVVSLNATNILVSLGKLVKTIEVELNRLFRILNEPSSLTSLEALGSTSIDQVRARLYRLLSQFMPIEIYQKWEHYRLFLEAQSQQQDFPAKKDALEEILLQEEYSNAFLPWLRALADVGKPGLSITVPTGPKWFDQEPGRSHYGDRNVTDLYFQERTFESVGPHDLMLRITAPEVDQINYKTEDLISQARIMDFSLVKLGLWKKNMPLLKPVPQLLSDQLDDLEREINVLLRHREDLDWKESEKLIEHLRIIMPVDMVCQDGYLLAVDNAARRTMKLSPEDTAEFWDLWGKWEAAYGTWLKSLPGEIHIDRGRLADAKFAKSIRFVTNSQSPYPLRIVRDRALPQPVQEIRDILVKVLQDTTNIADLSESTLAFLRTAIRPLYREKAQKLRALLEKSIKDKLCPFSDTASKSNVFLDAEDRVLIEVAIDIAYVYFLSELLKTSSPASPSISVIESPPGQFSISYHGSKGIDELTPSPQEIFDMLWLKHKSRNFYFIAHKQRFHKIAGRLRNEVPLTQGETLFVKDYILPLPRQKDIMIELCRFIQVLDDTGDLPKEQKNKYCELETSLLWHRWFYDYPSLVEKVGARQKIIDPVDDLLELRIAGLTRDPAGLPLISPPDKIEINEVQIEINNLLIKDRSKTASRNETRELDYFLIALLPQRLRKWKYMIDFQEKKYLAQEGLNASETLEFLTRERKFRENFDRYKAEIPKYGIILDCNWYSYTAICEVCSRARLWKEHTRNLDGSYNYPMTSKVIENFSLKIWHQQYALLKRNVQQVWTGDEDWRKLFLWDFMPQELRDFKQSLEDPRNSPKFNDSFSDQTHLLLKRSGFMHQYVCWISGYSPENIMSMRGKVGDFKGGYDYNPKAERRGVQRASIELALNHLATNQEQHRPANRFRVVDISGQPFFKPEKEVPICLPLEPWKRPLEQDPFDFTKKLAHYRQWKDMDYNFAHERTVEEKISILETPANYMGPIALADGETYREGSRQLQAHLASIALMMQEAQLKAPRPLMQYLLICFSDGLNLANDENGDGNSKHPLHDNVELTQRQLDLLVELSEESWDELKQDFVKKDLAFMTAEVRGQFEEFVNEIEAAGDLIPAWMPPQKSQWYLSAKNESQFLQPQHDPTFRPSTQGISVTRLMLILNESRQSHDPPLMPWTRRQMYESLRLMSNASHLYFHGMPRGGHGALPEESQRVWRIPLTGHPENKYVTTSATDTNDSAPGVKFLSNGLAAITYDENGTQGRPIELPRKYELLERLAYRLGRDCRFCLETAIGDYIPTNICLRKQLKQWADSVNGMKNITKEDRIAMNPGAKDYEPDKYLLKKLAIEVNYLAPDLAHEAEIIFPNNDPANMNVAQAAQILQMQVIEEVSNNWELRFPENEHVWNFAEHRLKEMDGNVRTRILKIKPQNKQFFSLRRFPVCCQRKEVQNLIVKYGPVVQEKPIPGEPPKVLTRAESWAQVAANLKPRPKKDRHIQGQQPYFPFGETPYQAAFQSFRMEQDLKDVPEFQPLTEPMNLIPRIFRKRKREGSDGAPAPKRFGLPDIPTNWEPDNISRAAKTAQMIEVLKRTPGMPDPNIPEHYYSQAEIACLERQEAWDTHCQRVGIANRAIENLTGKMVKYLRPAELNQASMDLDIDLTHGTLRNVPGPQLGQSTIPVLPALDAGIGKRPGGAPTPSGFAAGRANRGNLPALMPAPVKSVSTSATTGHSQSTSLSRQKLQSSTHPPGKIPKQTPEIFISQAQYDAMLKRDVNPWTLHKPPSPTAISPNAQGHEDTEFTDADWDEDEVE